MAKKRTAKSVCSRSYGRSWSQPSRPVRWPQEVSHTVLEPQQAEQDPEPEQVQERSFNQQLLKAIIDSEAEDDQNELQYYNADADGVIDPTSDDNECLDMSGWEPE